VTAKPEDSPAGSARSRCSAGSAPRIFPASNGRGLCATEPKRRAIPGEVSLAFPLPCRPPFRGFPA
jgi:hypothetical protein